MSIVTSLDSQDSSQTLRAEQPKCESRKFSVKLVHSTFVFQELASLVVLHGLACMLITFL